MIRTKTLGVAALVSLLAACGGGGGGQGHEPHHGGSGHHGNEPQGKAGQDPTGPHARQEEKKDDAHDKKVEDRTGWDKLGERMVDG